MTWIPPMKQDPTPFKRSRWMDPNLGIKLKLVAAIVSSIVVFALFGVGLFAIALIAFFFLTKAPSKYQRW